MSIRDAVPARAGWRALLLLAALTASAAAADGERARRTAEGEAALDRHDPDAALAAFERAAAGTHAGAIEAGLVRTWMLSGDYRRALAFAAHTAGAHRDEPAGAALYAWLLQIGGQKAMATRVLQAALERAPQDAVLTATAARLRDPAGPVAEVLLQPPWRQAPVASGLALGPGAEAIATGVLAGDGASAWMPLAALDPARERPLAVRDAFGRTVAAIVEARDDVLGLARLRLEVPLPAPPAWPLPPRPPHPGSPMFAVGFPAPADGTPQWPQMQVGFVGAPPADAAGGEGRALTGAGLRAGAAVFDAGGRWLGIAVADAPRAGAAALRLVPAGRLAAGDAGPRADAAAMAADETYERAMRTVVQIVALR